MKVEAAMWYETPGSLADLRSYPSIAAAKSEFADMIRDGDRYDQGTPVGCIYDPKDTSYPILLLDRGPRGGVKTKRVS